MLDITITNDQKINVALNPKTSGELPASLDGKPVWTVISGDATLSISNNGFSADLISGDSPGDSVIRVDADADLGDGVETISDTIKLHVISAKAASLGLSVGTPTEK